MSISSLTKESCINVRFYTNTRVIQDMHNQKMIGEGKRIADLYIISDSSSGSAQVNRVNTLFDDVRVSISSTANKVNTHTWHHRLGHLSFQKLALLKD